MALIQADRVKETSSTTGTGDFTLAGAETGFRSFESGVGSANTCYYVITDNTDYEIGLGTLSNSATLARTTVITSSNSNAAVDWGAGEKDVFTTYPGSKAVILDSSNNLNVATNISVGGTFQVTGDTDVSNLSASGTFDVGGNASVGGTLAVTSDADVSGNASVGGTFAVTGDTDVTNISADGTLDVSGNGSVGGTFNVEGDLKNTAGNLTVDPATQIFEIKGDGSSVEGQVQLNCHANSHGQIIKAQPHSEGVTNTMLLPKGSNSTLVSEIATQTLTNKTLGATSVDGTFNISGNASVGGTLLGTGGVSDADGNLRDIPVSENLSGSYTLQISDAGNQVTVNASGTTITVPTGVFAVGDIISIISVNHCTAILACTAVNAVKAGDAEATASHTLNPSGVASIMFSYSADLAVLTGNVSGVE